MSNSFAQARRLAPHAVLGLSLLLAPGCGEQGPGSGVGGPQGGSLASSGTGSGLAGSSSVAGSAATTAGTANASGGQGGSGGSTSLGAAGASRGPTPATATAKFPFPQNRHSANCTYPKDYRNEDVLAVYEQWKSHLVTSDGAGGFKRVKRPAEAGLEVNSTVSEGIAYGMTIAVYMNDQPLFDDLWKYWLLHTWNGTLLMNWYISSSGALGSNPSGNGAATDADEDTAWSLVMADKQWGGQGSLQKSYLDYAKQLIGDIWAHEIHEGKLPKNGSSWGDWNNLNVSYFAPAYYRVFAKVSGKAEWGTDVNKCVYDTINSNLTSENGNQSNGLVPAFSTTMGAQAQVGEGQPALKHHYQYDSCRTPFRIGLDACLFNEPRAKEYVAKTSQYQTFIDDSWNLLKGNNLWCGGQYYDESWTMLSMLVMSGNFLDYTVEVPK